MVMANPFTRWHLTDQLKNAMGLSQKFVVFMDASLDINMKYKKTIVFIAIVFFIIDFWTYPLTSEHTIGY